jgi:hypothetical protein
MLFVALIQILLVTAALAQINISTPPFLAQCQAWTITWTGGTGESFPYPSGLADASSVLRIHLPRILSRRVFFPV